MDHFSFNFGIAITAISILIALTSFILDTRLDLRRKLRKKWINAAILYSFLSVLVTFLAEIFIDQPFIFEIVGSIFMLLAIYVYCIAIFKPVSTIDKHNIKYLISTLDDFSAYEYQDDLLKHFGDITYFYDSLLKYSLQSPDGKIVFTTYFKSNLFLRFFSEHGFLFDKTIQYFINQQKISKNSYFLLQFINRLFVKSLNNKNSYLNSFLREDIYPDSLSFLDKLFLNNHDTDFSRLLFDDVRFYLDIDGKISYIRMVNRYFRLIYRENRSPEYQDGYNNNFVYNESLIKAFFKDIKDIFESTFDQNELNLMFEEMKNISRHYRWAVKTNDKSIRTRREAAVFLFDIFYFLISRYKVENEDIFRIRVYELFDEFIECQDNERSSNISYETFIAKLKETIIGDEHWSNYKGYYPAMIKIYFYIFGHSIFSGGGNDYDIQNLHLPILLKLAESLPKLYNGFKQEFYDLNSLPIGKEEKLKEEGRKIINDFLPNNISYNFEENSLTYYYTGSNYGSKIMLNELTDRVIKIEKV